jgi:hypothetical protein
MMMLKVFREFGIGAVGPVMGQGVAVARKGQGRLHPVC